MSDDDWGVLPNLKTCSDDADETSHVDSCQQAIVPYGVAPASAVPPAAAPTALRISKKRGRDCRWTVHIPGNVHTRTDVEHALAAARMRAGKARRHTAKTAGMPEGAVQKALVTLREAGVLRDSGKTKLGLQLLALGQHRIYRSRLCSKFRTLPCRAALHLRKPSPSLRRSPSCTACD